VGIPFRQNDPKQTRHRVQTGKGKPVAHDRRRPATQRLNRKGAKVFVEPGLPDDLDLGAGLQDGRHLAADPASDDTSMATMALGKDLDDGRGLSVVSDGQNRPFIAPFDHWRSIGAQPFDARGKRVAKRREVVLGWQ
jgi:hypothetical protein